MYSTNKNGKENKNRIIYHKLTDDLFLIMGNKFQEEMLHRYVNQKIYIETTLGVNECHINSHH